MVEEERLMIDGNVTSNGEIRFNGWVKWIGGFAVTMILASTGYTYVTVLPKLADNIIVNDRESRSRDAKMLDKVMENRVLIAEVTAMKIDIQGLKENIAQLNNVLRRAAPFELHENRNK